MRRMRADNVILIGFMGAGKSAVGRLLARRLGRCFVETDDMIVARVGRPIPEIFRVEGEERFRQLEADALDALQLTTGDVLATRGGLPRRACRTRLSSVSTQGRSSATARWARCSTRAGCRSTPALTSST